jgi:hypothetical protein
MSNRRTTQSVAPQVDYDLHGLLGVRLLNPSADNIVAVSGQLGLTQGSLIRDPDILVQFVERLSTRSPVVYLGLDDVGFTDDAFLIFQGQRRHRARVQIRYEQVGARCEIVCERGISSVPFLLPIINFTLLARGILPLHASAFKYNGVGVLVTGWTKGGKTEALLGFMARGAEYIGDEWVYISADGRFMYGIPIPVRIWQWHLDSIPGYRAHIGRRKLARMQSASLAHSALERMSLRTNGGVNKSQFLSCTVSLLRRQLFVDLHPRQLFDGTIGNMCGQFNQLVLVISHETSDVKVISISPEEVAQRMLFSLQYEYSGFLASYWKFRFAFPNLRNELIERAEQIQRQMMVAVFSDKTAYAVYHPYPVPIPAMVEAIAPLLTRP